MLRAMACVCMYRKQGNPHTESFVVFNIETTDVCAVQKMEKDTPRTSFSRMCINFQLQNVFYFWLPHISSIINHLSKGTYGSVSLKIPNIL